MKYIEILVCKLTILFLRRAYGATCPEVDEFIDAEGGCSGCKAKRCIEFLEENINLLKL